VYCYLTHKFLPNVLKENIKKCWHSVFHFMLTITLNHQMNFCLQSCTSQRRPCHLIIIIKSQSRVQLDSRSQLFTINVSQVNFYLFFYFILYIQYIKSNFYVIITIRTSFSIQNIKYNKLELCSESNNKIFHIILNIEVKLYETLRSTVNDIEHKRCIPFVNRLYMTKL
jgi:hypothetical protein